ncbi:MAG: serine hydrolase [Isosphaeraceae bacterium]|jgi:CubicO group peptidase (beta-lactamase class C family)|nr:MAG: serine hydrolase [Isosphaeraceae bacterium]
MLLRRWLILGLVVGLWAGRADAQGLPAEEAGALGFDAAKLSEVTDLLERNVREGRFAGISALVARQGRVVLLTAAGQADREAGEPMAPDTIVRIASMTKPITSVAAMILVDEGRLELDAPVARYLPEFERMKVLADESGPSIVDANRPITVRHLLTHTSGISYRFVGHPVLGPIFVEHAVSDGLSETTGTLADNVKRIARVPLVGEPGSQWHYGLNTDVLGRVIEVVSGQSLDAFFRERIFEPLGMVDTHFVLPAEKRPRLAAVYGIENDRPLERRPALLIQRGPLVYSTTYPVWDDNAGFYSGGAGLVSTLADYARFLQMVLNGGELDGVRILKPETVEAMTRNQIGDLAMSIGSHGTAFGYGFGVVTDAGTGPLPVGTFSWGGFFSTYFWVDPRNELIGIVFTQTHPAGANSLVVDFQRMVYEALEH